MLKGITNLALVDVDDVDIEIGWFEPYDPVSHRRLTTRYAGTHLFRRHDNRLEVVRLQEDAERIGDRFDRRSILRSGSLLCALLEESLARHLKRSNARTLSFRRQHPLVFVSLESKHDVAHQLFCRGTPRRLPLRVRKGFEVEARWIHLAQKRAVALAIDARTFASIEVTCDELISDGLDLVGLYVKEEVQAEPPHLGKKLQTVGVVARVEGPRLILGQDRRDNRTEILAGQVWLDASLAAVTRVLEHYIGPDAHDKLWGERGELASGSERWKRIDKLRARLASESMILAPGISWGVRGWLDTSTLQPSRVPTPRFVFGSGRISETAKTVLKTGPQHVPPALAERLDACVICEASRRDEVERFLKDLRDGFKLHRGLQSTWHVSDLRWAVFPARGFSAAAYEKACRDALDARADWKIVFVQVPASSRDLSGDDSPYLVTKAKFLARGIPVQEFTDESLRKPDNQRPYILGGIGLQVFAKLGGLPWLLEAPISHGHEVVLGLGSAQIGTGRFGDRERVVGLTTAFSGDGKYWLAEASRTVPYAEHEVAVGEAVVSAVRRVRAEMAWRRGDPIRLVFHSFKPFRGAHVARIQEFLRSLREDGHAVECAFVHVVETHPTMLFDLQQTQHIPPRGLSVRLRNHEALVSVMGPEEVRQDNLGFPTPLLLKVHRDSTFSDLDYLARQVLAFCSHSWRNFTPTTLPVTILYSELIAKLLGRLGNLSRWDPDVLRGEVGRTRWFL